MAAPERLGLLLLFCLATLTSCPNRRGFRIRCLTTCTSCQYTYTLIGIRSAACKSSKKRCYQSTHYQTPHGWLVSWEIFGNSRGRPFCTQAGPQQQSPPPPLRFQGEEEEETVKDENLYRSSLPTCNAGGVKCDSQRQLHLDAIK